MAIKWGSWQYGGGNGMRVGMDVSVSTVSFGSTKATVTYKIYTQNQYRYNDLQTLNYGYDLSGTTDYNNVGSSGSTSLRATRTSTHTYSGSSYGTSPGRFHASARVSGAYNGVEPRIELYTTIPARPYGAPSAPSAVGAVRNSDSQATVTWTRNVTSGRPYTGITVQMQTLTGTSWSGWSTVATPSGSASSTVVKGLVGNRGYRFQVRANNTVGSSAYVGLPVIYMTPAAPVGVSAAVNAGGGSIGVTWINTAYVAAGNLWEIQRSVNGGPYSPVASGLVQASTTWTDPSPGAGSNTYQVRLTRGVLSSGWATSNVVATIVAPFAPTLLVPDGVAVDLEQDQIFRWRHNHGGDGAAQSVFDVDYSDDGGITWLPLTVGEVSTVPELLIPAGTLPNGTLYQWRVRTQGIASVGYSPWSQVATVTGRDQPTLTLDPDNPANPIGQTPLTVGWAFNQNQGDLQIRWEAELYDTAGNLLEVASADNAADTAVFDTAMIDGNTYRIRVRALSSAGQWTDWAQTFTTVDLLPPADVNLDPYYDDCTGSISLVLVPDEPVPGLTVPVDYVDVQRRINRGEWVTIMTHIDVPTSILDLTPITVGFNEYRLLITSITPSQALSDIVTVNGDDPCNPHAGQWVFVSYGADFTTTVRFQGDPQIGTSTDRVRASQHFLGRPKPHMLLGANTDLIVNASGSLHFADCCTDSTIGCDHDSPVEDWQAAGRDAGLVLYRDWTGRRMFGMLSGVTCADVRPNFGTVSFTVTETGYTERMYTGIAPDTDTETEPSNLFCYGSFEDFVPSDMFAAVITQDDSWASEGAYSLQITPDGTNPESGVYLTGAGDSNGMSMRALGMRPGRTYTVSADFHMTGAQTGTIDGQARRISIGTQTGGIVDPFVSSPQAPNAATTTRLTVIFDVPDNVEDVTVRLMNGSANLGQSVWWDAVMVEEGATDGLWAEGCIRTPTNRYAENPSFELPYTGASARSTGVRSSAWASQGGFCLKNSPDGINGNATYALPGGDPTLSGASMTRLNMSPGNTYTVSADLYMPAEQVGTLNNSARTILVRYIKGSLTWQGAANSVQAPNVAGTQERLSVTVSIPSDADDILIVFYNGSGDATDSLYWDALMVEDGVTAGVWSDGVLS